MSSAVNKSSTRFVPKHPVRGTARKQPRKLSIVASKDEYARLPSLTVSDGFNMRRTSRSQSSVGQNAPVVINEAHVLEDENAIADDEDTMPVKAPKTRRLDRTAKIERPSKISKIALEKDNSSPADAVGVGVSSQLPTENEASNSIERNSTSLEDNQENENKIATKSSQRSKVKSAAVSSAIKDAGSLKSSIFVEPTTAESVIEAAVEDKDSVVNADKFTMAEMCDDLNMGQVSSKHGKFMQVLDRRRLEKNALRRKRNKARTNPELLYQFRTELQQRDSEKRQQTQHEAQEKLAIDMDKTPAPVLQLRMGEGGTFALDVESTIVDRHRNNGEGQEQLERREARDVDRIINSASYSRHERSERWDVNETEEFYKAISMWGTDFNMISKLFPGRSRRQIKSKYKLEEKKNPAKLHLATIRKLPINMPEYTGLLELQNIQMMDVAEVEGAIEKIQAEFQQRMKQDAETRQQNEADDIVNKSSIKRETKAAT